MTIGPPFNGGGTGGYGWVKNLLGKFSVDVDEPFDGRVTSIAKTECRGVPLSVTSPAEVQAKFIAADPPFVSEILVGGTAP